MPFFAHPSRPRLASLTLASFLWVPPALTEGTPRPEILHLTVLLCQAEVTVTWIAYLGFVTTYMPMNSNTSLKMHAVYSVFLANNIHWLLCVTHVLELYMGYI